MTTEYLFQIRSGWFWTKQANVTSWSFTRIQQVALMWYLFSAHRLMWDTICLCEHCSKCFVVIFYWTNDLLRVNAKDLPKFPCYSLCGKETLLMWTKLNSLTTKKQTTKFSSASFQNILSPNYIILRIQRLEGGGRVVRWCWVNFLCRGAQLNLIRAGQGPTALAVDAGGDCLVIFLLSIITLLSPSLWETAWYLDSNTVSKGR